ncbi:hypothetical protein SAMN04489867_0104 [Pedococcus dokdonensis]|uniref:Integral membrane protein n=1 Tax=Pedococcus dokdonensis TaxID=443156 RepID=A0A1H0KTX0_9MICO|nr:hypothetical protein [Pedococcus dokdonensis]SDO59295.1 hypothetical protein SAMN04489867_0104 [Pedococcus dokdonensis]
MRSLGARVAVAYLALRAVSAVLLVLASRDQVVMPDWTGPTVEPIDMSVLWDGSWYRHIAEHGYPHDLPVDPGSGRVSQNAWAFYPLFPLLSKLLMQLTGLGFPVVASALSLVCGLGAALIMGRLLADRVGDRLALATVAAWGAFPAAVSLQIAYTEAIAMLVLCALLWALTRRSWVAVGALAVLLGVTRPIAVPVAVVVAVALFARWRRRGAEPIGPGEYTAGAVALAGSALGAVAWPLIAWRVTGVRSAYTDTMASWRVDGAITPFKPWLGMSQWTFREFEGGAVYGPVALAALATTIVVLTCGPWATALGVELRAWCLAYPAYLAVVLDPFTSIFRYALPLFPLFAVLLGGLSSDRGRSWLWARAGTLIAIGVAGQALWIWKLLVYHPPSDYPP